MNERIDQLRLEAGISRLHDEPKFMVAVSKEGTVIEPLDGLEKFAELIVRECLRACSKANEIRYPVPPTKGQVVVSCMREIEKHFGVE